MKKINSIFAISIIVLLTISMFAIFSQSNLINNSTVNAQSVSTVPSNLLNYIWVARQGGLFTHFSAGPGPTSPDVLWQRIFPANLGATPVAFDGMLFVTEVNQIMAMDPETGNIIYNVTVPIVLPGRTSSVTAVTDIDNATFVAMSTTAAINNATGSYAAAWCFRGFRASDGTLLWSMPLQYGPASSSFAYVADIKGVVVNVGNSTGTGGTQNPGALQDWSLPDPTQPPTLKWTYINFGGISGHSNGLYGQGLLFPGSNEPEQVALNASTGQVVWDRNLTGLPYYGGSYSNGVLYKGLLNNDFVAFNATTGDTIWKYNPNDYGFWSSATAVGYGMVYELNVDGKLYCFNATNGNLIWTYTGPGQVYPGAVQIAGGNVYACTGQAGPSPNTGVGQSQYSCLNAYTGQVIWQVSKEFFSGPSDYTAIAYGNFYGIDQELSNGTTVNTSAPGFSPSPTQHLLVCYTSAPQDWSMYGQNPAHNAVGYGGPKDLTLNWNYTTGGAIVSSPAVVSGRVYIGSDDGNIYCFNSTTGIKYWTFNVGEPVRSSPAVVNSLVYTGADNGYIYCLDALTGAMVWNVAAPGSFVPIMTGTFPQLTSSPTVANGNVYVGANDGNMYCLNAATGAIIWKIQTTNAIFDTPTLIAGDGLYFASIDGFVYKVDPSNGNILWNVSTPIGLERSMEGSVCVGAGLAVIGSGGAKNTPAGIGQMYAFNTTNGKLVWKNSELANSGNEQPTWTPIFLNSQALGPVFIYADTFDMNCVRASNGSLIWQTFVTREHFSLPAYSDGKIYVGSNSFGPYVLDAASGQKIGYFNTGGEVEGSIAIYDNSMYFGSFDGNIYSLGQSSSNTTYIGNPVVTPIPTATPAPTIAPSPTASPTQQPMMQTMYNSLNTAFGAALLIIIVLVIGIAIISALILRQNKKPKT